MPLNNAATATTQPFALAQTDSTVSRQRFDLLTLFLFTIAIFTSATLLFVVQPMVGKILLPNLGGAPAVWNTCMVFFQATLLAGYLTAHLLTKYVPLRYQIIAYVIALVLAMQSLPISVGPEWVEALMSGGRPVTWLLSVLICQVAPVFFVMSTTSPLMQKWFARSGHPQGSDPYFLYAASNVGSILALLAYPLFVETNLGVTDQTTTWMWGFGFFAILATACGLASWFGSNLPTSERGTVGERLNKCGTSDSTLETATEQNTSSQATTPTWSRRGFWGLLAFIPSSLMLGVTTYISTDVSAIPLIWAIPLAMYLLTFVFAFSKWQPISAYWMGRVASLLILVITVTMVLGANDPPTVIVPLHLLMFFTVAMFCHQRLAADRPSEEHLTDFYLWLSVGGVAGGIFNALLAPSLFVSIIEYPLIMSLASYFRVTKNDPQANVDVNEADAAKTNAAAAGNLPQAFAFGAGIFVTLVALRWGIQMVPSEWIAAIENISPLSVSQIETLLTFGAPAALVLHNIERRSHFTFGLVAIFLVSVWNQYSDANCLQRDRNFYGTLATTNDQLIGGDVVKMWHGNTVHGTQWKDEARRRTPLTYYGKSSGVGRLLAVRQQNNEKLDIGAVGLGAGTLAAVLRPADAMRYYEINPQVVEHAEKYFTFLGDARERGANLDIELGDARLVLEKERREGTAIPYDVLVVDAFSSDSIPAHLITNECFQLYLSRIKAGGVVAMHISNRFLDLRPALAKLCEANGVVGYSYCFVDIKDDQGFDEKSGETASLWVLIANESSYLEDLHGDPNLSPLRPNPADRLWTDDYSNVLSAFNFRL